jgi:hypothetical protein
MTELETAAEIYAATFAGSLDAYSTFSKTQDHWVAVREPLTPQVVLRAFETNIPISGYVLGQDDKTHVAALDIDRDDGWALGVRFAKQLVKSGGIAYIERSRRGSHVWSILKERLPGIAVRRALKALIMEADLPVDPKIELRPGSDRLGIASADEPPKLGHCIRLATMPHHRTGIRSALIDASSGEKLPGKLCELVTAIELTDPSVFIEAAQRAPLPPISPPPFDLRYRFGVPEGQESASEILRVSWGVANARPGKAVKCPAHPDQHPSLSILRDDQRAICKTPGCLLNNNDRGRGTYELQQMAHRA